MTVFMVMILMTKSRPSKKQSECSDLPHNNLAIK